MIFNKLRLLEVHLHLYANGATGGIINIVDNTIATSDIGKRLLKLGFETQSVNSGDGQSFSVADNLGGLTIFLI